MSKAGQVEVECEVLQEKGQALEIRVKLGGITSTCLWIPLSQISEIHRDDGFIVMAEWLARKEGLIDE